ncbi:hypothetical protein ACJX0J_031277, partial [Zea mays]
CFLKNLQHIGQYALKFQTFQLNLETQGNDNGVLLLMLVHHSSILMIRLYGALQFLVVATSHHLKLMINGIYLLQSCDVNVVILIIWHFRSSWKCFCEQA